MQHILEAIQSGAPDGRSEFRGAALHWVLGQSLIQFLLDLPAQGEWWRIGAGILSPFERADQAAEKHDDQGPRRRGRWLRAACPSGAAPHRARSRPW
jgi:hypothetical protein